MAILMNQMRRCKGNNQYHWFKVSAWDEIKTVKEFHQQTIGDYRVVECAEVFPQNYKMKFKKKSLLGQPTPRRFGNTPGY